MLPRLFFFYLSSHFSACPLTHAQVFRCEPRRGAFCLFAFNAGMLSVSHKPCLSCHLLTHLDCAWCVMAFAGPAHSPRRDLFGPRVSVGMSPVDILHPVTQCKARRALTRLILSLFPWDINRVLRAAACIACGAQRLTAVLRKEKFGGRGIRPPFGREAWVAFPLRARARGVA